MQKLIASKTQRYGTRMLSADEPFEADRSNARLLVALGRARLAPAPAPEPSTDELRAAAEALGVEVDKRWGDRRLKDEIEKARA